MAARRFGNETAETRTVLLDLAERMMAESGYAAVTSRQVGKAAGLSPQILYYYFKTMDDLFEALVARSSEYYLSALDGAEASPNPLLFMWELSCDRSRAIVVQELMALANHRKALMSMLSDFGREYHARQTRILERSVAAKRVDLNGMSPAVVAATLEITARGFAAGVGYDIPGHQTAEDYIKQLLRQTTIAPVRKRAPRRSAETSAT